MEEKKEKKEKFVNIPEREYRLLKRRDAQIVKSRLHLIEAYKIMSQLKLWGEIKK